MRTSTALPFLLGLLAQGCFSTCRDEVVEVDQSGSAPGAWFSVDGQSPLSAQDPSLVKDRRDSVVVFANERLQLFCVRRLGTVPTGLSLADYCGRGGEIQYRAPRSTVAYRCPVPEGDARSTAASEPVTDGELLRESVVLDIPPQTLQCRLDDNALGDIGSGTLELHLGHVEVLRTTSRTRPEHLCYDDGLRFDPGPG